MADPLITLGREVHTSLENARASRNVAASVRERLQRGAAWGEARRSLSAHPALKGGRPALAMALALAAGFAVVVGSVARLQNPALSFHAEPEANGKTTGDSGFIASREKSRPVHFSDGSELVLAPQTQMRVLETNPNGARVVLERGRTDVQVKHRDKTTWQFVAGPYQVDVIGTAFELSWSPESNEATVRMREGKVSVRGCDLELGRPLVAGDTLIVRCDPTVQRSALSLLPSATPNPGPNMSSGATEAIAETAAPAPFVEPAPIADPIVAAGTASAKHPTAHVAPSTNVVTSGEAPDALWSRGRSARARGDVSAARKLRLEFRKRFPSDERARVAAFELGQLAFDVDSDLNEASTWFTTYLREAPNGSLAREAMGRSMEARQKLGDFQGSRSLARDYLARFAGGPHDTLARELVDRGQ